MPSKLRSKSAVIAGRVAAQRNRLRNEALWRQKDSHQLSKSQKAADARSSEPSFFGEPSTNYLTRYFRPSFDTRLNFMPRNFPYKGQDYTYPIAGFRNPRRRTDGTMTTQEWQRHNERLTSGTVAGILAGITHAMGASPETQDGLFTIGTGVDQAISARRRDLKARSDVGGAWHGAKSLSSNIPQYRYTNTK